MSEFVLLMCAGLAVFALIVLAVGMTDKPPHPHHCIEGYVLSVSTGGALLCVKGYLLKDEPTGGNP